MTDFPTVTELMREHAYLRSLRDRWSVGFERLRRLDLPGGDEPDANLPAMAADEIERLRAALEDAEHHADLRQIEVERLQALIDAFVAADLNPDDSGYDAAYAALLAAATKEDDRG